MDARSFAAAGLTWTAKPARPDEGREPLRLIVPYTSLRPETAAALAESGFPFEEARVDDGDGYCRLLSGLWRAGESFAIVEQDIVVGPGTLPDLAACPRDWCSFGYAYMTSGNYHGLGCARFSSALLARVPDAMDRVAVMSDKTHPPGHWCRLDGWLALVLTSSGEKRCEHLPPVGHLHRYPSHGCVTAPR